MAFYRFWAITLPIFEGLGNPYYPKPEPSQAAAQAAKRLTALNLSSRLSMMSARAMAHHGWTGEPLYTPIHTCICVCIYTYMYLSIYIYRERERERENLPLSRSLLLGHASGQETGALVASSAADHWSRWQQVANWSLRADPNTSVEDARA